MIEPLSYFDSDPPPDKELQSVQTFINIVNSLLRPEKIDNEDSDEQKHQNRQPDLPYGPKLAEIPDLEDIAKSKLIKSLNFNPKLSIQQKKQLESVIKCNHKAFSLDGHIGEYSDIKYSIKLQPDAEPISMAPYHASPEKRKDIDKQIDKWFAQGVICKSDSPWGAPIIVVYWNGKAHVCIDYW